MDAKQQELPDLSKVEWELMNQMWRRRKTTVADLHAHFHPERQWSHNTVKTMLQRLVKKGYLACDDSQWAHVYRPAVPRKRVLGNSLGETLDRMLDGRLDPLIAYAARRKNLSDEEIAQLWRILEGKGEDDESTD